MLYLTQGTDRKSLFWGLGSVSVKEKFPVYHFSSLTSSPFFQNQVCQDGRLCKHLIKSSPLLETSKRFTSAGCFGLYLYTFPSQQPLFTHSLSKCLSAALLSLRPSVPLFSLSFLAGVRGDQRWLRDECSMAAPCSLAQNMCVLHYSPIVEELIELKGRRGWRGEQVKRRDTGSCYKC